MSKMFRSQWVPVIGMTVAILTLYLHMTGYSVAKVETTAPHGGAVAEIVAVTP